ncbi:Rad17 cell cycle checkpoint protein-domain-containing protein [Mycena amicta]|nr:Rad17 cell cycle checkpoint protein-domain-containing protein [Mycena amicta]
MAPKKPPAKTKPKPTTVRLDAAPSSSTRINPLTAFTAKPKGKAKEKAQDDRLWVDIYEPTTHSELAIHPKKVEDVRRWLDEALVGGPTGKLRKYRRILALTGLAGTGKTATIRVLAKELDCEVLEWRNSMGGSITSDFKDDQLSLFSKFENFLERASTCNTVFSGPSSSQHSTTKRRIVLLEDLPNILHADTRARFHAAFQSLVASPDPDPVPVVIIVSDTGIRGEAADDRLSNGNSGFGRERDDAVDIYTILPRDLLNGPYVTQIGFNPIAPTIMKKALQSLISTHFSSSATKGSNAPSKEMLDIIVETSNGDIRSAIMALQFSCIVELPSAKRKKGSSKGNAKVLLEAITRREQSLVLFHLLGKVLYNKRKGDPPNPSATAKDIQKDKDLDATLRDLPKLPSHLSAHARRTSRVNVDVLYADSPIDSSLFSLYIHQNYQQYCNEIEECEGVAEWLSWAESSGGEAWYQANPHQFHLLALGTLHSLPSPVPRRSQKSFKPQFFDFLTKEKEAWDAVRDVRGWIMGDPTQDHRVGTWTRAEVVTELGGVLKARDGMPSNRAPASHRLFSSLQFVSGSDGAALSQLGEGDRPSVVEGPGLDDPPGGWDTEINEGGGWLENDDIEDF